MRAIRGLRRAVHGLPTPADVQRPPAAATRRERQAVSPEDFDRTLVPVLDHF
jgi:hypothetical protein